MKHVNLYGPVNQLGFGVHFQNWAAEVARAAQNWDYSIGIHPRAGSERAPYFLEEDRLAVWKKAADPRNFMPNALSISLWHANQVTDFAGGKRAIYTVWEGSEPPPAYLPNIRDKVDFVIVPTLWHYEQLEALGLEHKAYIIQEGVDTNVYKPTGRSSGFTEDLGDYEIFLHVGKMEKRKGIDCTIHVATQIAKEHRNDVPNDLAFILHWHNPFIPNWQAVLDQMLKGWGWTIFRVDDEKRWVDFHHKSEDENFPTVVIRVITQPLKSPYEMQKLYSDVTWSFQPTYAEGWGLPILESMACGTPVICQRHSGMTEYLKPGSFVPLKGYEEVAHDGLWFHGDQGTWMKTNREHAVEAVMMCLEFNDGYDDLATRSRKLAKDFSFEQTVQRSFEVINHIHSL